jgi:alcohol dehydrogenase class IV
MRLLSLHQPRKLSFGAGALALFADDFAATGRQSLIVATAPPILPLIAETLDRLRRQGTRVTVIDSITREPTVADLESALAAAAAAQGDSVAGIGGGSVLDVAKLLAATLGSPQPIADILGGAPLAPRSAYLACLPTTAGNGSEVSPNAILLDERDNMKKAVVNPLLVPDAAYVDPALTLGLPPKQTAETGMDALCHCIEAYTNRFAHPVVDLYALEGVRLIAGNLLAAVRDGQNIAARTALALGSLYGGLCLGPVNTALVHALSYPLGGEFHVPHGLANAMILPEALAFNIDASVARHAKLAAAMGIPPAGTDEDMAQQSVVFVRRLARSCGIPAKLSDIGVAPTQLDRLADMAMSVQRLLKNNPKEVGVEDAKAIYRRLF